VNPWSRVVAVTIAGLPGDLQKQIPYSAGIVAKGKDAQTASGSL
jgi:hypothetical protein